MRKRTIKGGIDTPRRWRSMARYPSNTVWHNRFPTFPNFIACDHKVRYEGKAFYSYPTVRFRPKRAVRGYFLTQKTWSINGIREQPGSKKILDQIFHSPLFARKAYVPVLCRQPLFLWHSALTLPVKTHLNGMLRTRRFLQP